MKKVRFYNIDWDIRDGEDVPEGTAEEVYAHLPEEHIFIIEDELTDEELEDIVKIDGADWLTDEYGFLVECADFEIINA